LSAPFSVRIASYRDEERPVISIASGGSNKEHRSSLSACFSRFFAKHFLIRRGPVCWVD
jgi:hypothetical protein